MKIIRTKLQKNSNTQVSSNTIFGYGNPIFQMIIKNIIV